MSGRRLGHVRSRELRADGSPCDAPPFAEMTYGHLEKLISVPIADPSGVNVYESERERNRIIEGNFVVRDWWELFFEVPIRLRLDLIAFCP